MTDKQTPQSPDSEKALLGCVFSDPEIADDVFLRVNAECFYVVTHRHVFNAMHELYKEGAPIDLVTVSEKMLAHKLGEFVPELPDIASRIPTSAQYEYYIGVVRENYERRKIIQECHRLMDDAYDTSLPITESVDRFENQITLRADDDSELDAEQLMMTLDDPADKPVPTGFKKFDALFGGFWKKELTIIGGRPSMGKTALALALMRNMAKQGIPVVFFSLEMSRESVARRLASMESGVPHEKIRKNNMGMEDIQRFSQAVKRISTYPIIVKDLSSISIYDVKAVTRKYKRRGKCEAVFIDYLQNMKKVGGGETNAIKTGLISREAKSLAKELDISVTLLSQLRRTDHDRARMSDLRDSGEIEQDADIIIFPHREHAVNPDAPKEAAELMIVKNRNGRTGILDNIGWDGDRVNFFEIDERF